MFNRRRRLMRWIGMGVVGGGGDLASLALDFAAGASASQLIGPTWTTDGAKLINTPSLGSELWDAAAAAFTSGTYAWVAQGNNTLNNPGGQLDITYVDNQTGAKENLTDAADLSADLDSNEFYRLALTTWMNTGSAILRVYDGAATLSAYTEVATSPTSHIISWLRYVNSIPYLDLNALGTGEIFSLDNISLKKITKSDCWKTARFVSQFGTLKAAWTVPGTQPTFCGLAINLDHPTNPQNGVLVIRTPNRMKIIKLLNGTLSTVLQDVSSTASAGGVVEIRHLTADTYQMFYNNVQVGTDQTISGMTGTYHGLFSTDPTAQCISMSFTQA